MQCSRVTSEAPLSTAILPISAAMECFRNVPERFRHRRYEQIEECLRLFRPQRPALLDPVILPVELRHAVLLRHDLEEFAEHEVAADRHGDDQDDRPE